MPVGTLCAVAASAINAMRLTFIYDYLIALAFAITLCKFIEKFPLAQQRAFISNPLLLDPLTFAEL